ncbi:MAG: sugar transferase [Chloroflexota bacterium]|nr:sugar transferase [Chloroflexota bacterium]
MTRRYILLLHLSFMVADGLSAAILLIAVSIARFGPSYRDWWVGAVGIEPLLAAAVYGFAWVSTLWVLGLYRLRARWSARTELRDIIRAALLLSVAVFTALFLFKLPNMSRLLLVLLFGAQVFLSLASRLAVRRVFEALREQGYNIRYMLVVGAGPAARSFANRIDRRRDLGLRVVGHLSHGETDPRLLRPVLGRLEDIEQVLHAGVIDEVAICLPASEVTLIEPVTRLCEEEGKIVRIPLTDFSLTLPGGRAEEFDGIQVLSLVYGPDRVISLLTKRFIDIALATVGLIVLSPLLLVVGLAMLSREGRPLLFRQVRVGLHGRPFRIVKFRTMTVDAEARYPELEAFSDTKGPAFKMTDDPRVTRLGRLLRRTSIDELPQLWNVLLGEMSIVGPRPAPPREVAGYDVWHRRRLSMKPGITGLWQVEARFDEQFDHRATIDLAYIDRWSLWLDLRIIARTIPALVTQPGR